MINGYPMEDCNRLNGACLENEYFSEAGLSEEQESVAEKQPEQQPVSTPEKDRTSEQAGPDNETVFTFNNEKLQHWVDLGAALCFLGELDSIDSVPEAFWNRYQSVVDKTDALDLVHAVSFLPGEAIRTALSGICILNSYKYCCQSPAGLVPALFVEFLIQYQSFYADRNYVKCSMGLYALVMEDNGYASSNIAHSLGTGNDRIPSAVADLEKNGILVDAGHINAPGAGRDDIDTFFAYSITPEVIAAEIKYKDLQFRKTLKELEELTTDGTGRGPDPEDGKMSGAEPSADGGTDSETQPSDGGNTQGKATPESGANAQSEGPDYKTCTTEEVDPCKLKDDTMKAVDEANDILAFALEGEKMDINLLNLVKRLREEKETVAAYYSLVFPGGDGADENVLVSFNLVPAFVEFCDTLRRRCDTIIEVKKKNEDLFDKENGGNPEKAPYWRRKLLHQAVDRKWFLIGLDDEKYRYVRICELLQEVKLYADAAEAESPAEETGSDTGREKRYEKSRANAFASLEAVIKKIEEALEKTAKGTQFYQKADETVRFLRTLQEDLTKAVRPELAENPDISILQEVMACMLELHMGEALELWEAHKKRRDALKQVVSFLNTEKFTSWVVRTFRTYDKVFQDSKGSQEASEAVHETGSQAPEEQDAGSQEADMTAAEAVRIALEEARACAFKAIETAIDSFRTLITLLRIASDSQVLRKNSTPNPIPEAVIFLEGMLDRLVELETEVENTLSVSVRNALRDMALSFNEKNIVWLETLSADRKYSTGKQVANSINRQRYHDFCEKQADMALAGGEDKGWDADVLGHYKEMHTDDPLGLQSPEGCTISPSERREIILELWKRGMDPTSVKAWLQYITEQNSRAIFADPMGNVSCCKLTPEELSSSFRYLTGCKFSGRALWDYLVKRMGYTRHQCVKEEQIGEAHPQRDEQYKFIDSEKMIAISNGKILILSCDSKAVVKLGRFKHDNGLLLCSPDGRVYRVHDHDFVFTWLDLYGEDGFCPVGKNRLKEKAVVHPCAVYDVLANTCHVSFVLGTENSESMANILIKAIKDKLEERPDIESVLILSDGGGVNSSNSYIWKNELLRVADETNLQIQISHYPPGCSRHNPVERGVFAPLSRAWKGKSLHNLEVLAALTCAATTKNSKKGSPLKVTVFIDLKQYKTIKQKIADNETVITREEFEKKAKGRIIHPFTEADGALYKWNYIVLPSNMKAKENR